MKYLFVLVTFFKNTLDSELSYLCSNLTWCKICRRVIVRPFLWLTHEGASAVTAFVQLGSGLLANSCCFVSPPPNSFFSLFLQWGVTYFTWYFFYFVCRCKLNINFFIEMITNVEIIFYWEKAYVQISVLFFFYSVKCGFYSGF